MIGITTYGDLHTDVSRCIIKLKQKVKISLLYSSALCLMKPYLHAKLRTVGAIVIEFHFFNQITKRKKTT